jgi:hypothetical protein
VILLDFSSLFIQVAFGLKKRGLIYSKDHLRNAFLSRIFALLRRFRRFGDLYIFTDKGDYWRADVFGGYKRRRAERRLIDDVDWDELHRLQNEIDAEMKENLPFPIVGVERLEADDLIAMACRFYAPRAKQHLILSSDKDLTQLLRSANINQYSIGGKSFLKYDSHAFKAHLLRGDNSDSIPSIYFDGEYLIKSNGRRRLTDARLREIDITSEDNFIKYFHKDPEADLILKNYNRNRLLIDLRCIPKRFLPVFRARMKEAKVMAAEAAARSEGYLLAHNLLKKFQAARKELSAQNSGRSGAQNAAKNSENQSGSFEAKADNSNSDSSRYPQTSRSKNKQSYSRDPSQNLNPTKMGEKGNQNYSRDPSQSRERARSQNQSRDQNRDQNRNNRDRSGRKPYFKRAPKPIMPPNAPAAFDPHGAGDAAEL